MRIGYWLRRRYYLWRGIAPLRIGSDVSLRYRVGTRLEANKVLACDGESDTLEFFVASLRPGDVVYDVGANLGLYALPAAHRVGGGGKVVAFEPIPPWLGRLRENAALNGIENLLAFDVGLSDRDTEVEFIFKDLPGSGMASAARSYDRAIAPELRRTLRARLVHGDRFVYERRLPPPHVVKIDVEGAELDVLRGLASTIRSPACRLVLCEVHPRFLPGAPQELAELLRAAGFAVRKTFERGDEYYLVASRADR